VDALRERRTADGRSGDVRLIVPSAPFTVGPSTRPAVPVKLCHSPGPKGSIASPTTSRVAAAVEIEIRYFTKTITFFMHKMAHSRWSQPILLQPRRLGDDDCDPKAFTHGLRHWGRLSTVPRRAVSVGPTDQGRRSLSLQCGHTDRTTTCLQEVDALTKERMAGGKEWRRQVDRPLCAARRRNKHAMLVPSNSVIVKGRRGLSPLQQPRESLWQSRPKSPREVPSAPFASWF